MRLAGGDLRFGWGCRFRLLDGWLGGRNGFARCVVLREALCLQVTEIVEALAVVTAELRVVAEVEFEDPFGMSDAIG